MGLIATGPLAVPLLALLLLALSLLALSLLALSLLALSLLTTPVLAATALSSSTASSSQPPQNPPLSVSGTVLKSADGAEGGVSVAPEPLSDATLRLFRLDNNYDSLRRIVERAANDEAVAKGRTDADGRFVLTVPEPGIWRLVVEASGHVPMLYALLPLTDPLELPPVTLLPDVGVTVQLLDARSQPMADVLVLAQSAEFTWWQEVAQNGWSPDHRYGRSDAGGWLRLPRGPGEPLRLLAMASGHALPREHQVAAEAPVHDITWSWSDLESEARTLEVVEDDGAAAAEVLVAVDDLALPAGLTDASGRLTLQLPSGTGPVVHLLSADGRYVQRPLTIDGSASSKAQVISLPTRRWLEGQVMEPGRQAPLASALVWSGSDPGRLHHTDADGRFRLPVASGSRFWIQAQAPGHGPLLQRLAVPAGGGGSTVTTAPLVLSPSVALRGVVVTADGVPQAGVAVQVTPVLDTPLPPAYRPDRAHSRTFSDAAGSFLLAGLHAEASYEVSARDAGGRGSLRGHARVQGVGHLEAPLRLILRPARPAFGVVLDDDEAPVADAAVVLRDAMDGGRALEPVRTGLDGRFAVADLPAAVLDLEVSKEGYPPVNVRAVDVSAAVSRAPSANPSTALAAADGAAAPSASAPSATEVSPPPQPVDLGAILLRRGVALLGRVVDEQGQGILGAKVVAQASAVASQKSLANRQLSRRPAESAADGIFRLTGLLPGQRLFLTVQHGDYSPQVVEGVDVPSERPVRVVLGRACRVSGRVVDEDGQPVVGAKVNLGGAPRVPGTVGLRRPGDDNGASTPTDDDGRFDFRGVIPGTIKISALSSEHQPAEPLLLEVEPAVWVDDVELVLRQGHRLSGTVRNAAGQPIADVRLTSSHALARSGSDGTFRLAGLPLGEQELEVRHDDYNRLLQSVTLEEGDNHLDVELVGGSSVSGRVVDGDGQPLAGAVVRFELRARRDHHDYQAVSDGNGRFEVAPLARGPYRVEASLQGFAPRELDGGLEVAAEPIEDIELVLSPGHEVFGRVLGLDFAELAAVEVEAEQGAHRVVPAVVDYAGAFRLTDLAPGNWILRARLDGGQRQAESRFTLPADVQRLERDIEFDGGLRLSGQVMLDGQPLPGTWVSLRGLDSEVERSVSNDFEGRFQIDDLTAGSYRLSLSNRREMLVHNEDLRLLEDLDVAIDLASTQVSGIVTARDSGRPLPEARVILQQMHGESGDEAGSMIVVATDAGGAFTLARVSAGNYRLRVETEGFSPWSRAVVVEPGVDVGPLEIQLDATRGLGLRVRLTDGSSPDWVSVSLFGDRGEHLLSRVGSPDDSGQVVFPTLPEGTWTARIGAAGGAPQTLALEIPGEPRDMVLEEGVTLRLQIDSLAQGSRLATLTLVGPDGRPFAQAEPGGVWRDRWPVVQGGAEVGGLAAGPWGLEVTASDGQRWQATVQVAAGQAVEVRLD